MPRGDQSPPASLLIVDDNEAIRESIRLLLEDAGYTILEASNGHDALTVLRESSQPLVVLLDDRMPDLSGEEVLRAVLRDRQLRRRHTFILLSAAPHLSRRLRLQRMLQALAIEVVPKPFDVADLEEAVVRAQTRQHHLRSFRLPVPGRSR
jgi:sigma-B regulation protein RsbU (phosphoserine phosphatase)